MKQKVMWTALLGVLLGACAAAPSRPPVVEESQQAPIAREPVDTETPTADTNTTAATTTLLAAARTASDENDHGNAIAYLERAVRIDPRNAELWIHLSAAHLDNGNIAAATQHARKAIALAAEDRVLTRMAWLQLADVREAEGNRSEAQAIRRRYRSIRG